MVFDLKGWRRGMSGQSVQPSKRRGTERKEEEDGRAGETLVLNVFW